MVYSKLPGGIRNGPDGTGESLLFILAVGVCFLWSLSAGSDGPWGMFWKVWEGLEYLDLEATWRRSSMGQNYDA